MEPNYAQELHALIRVLSDNPEALSLIRAYAWYQIVAQQSEEPVAVPE